MSASSPMNRVWEGRRFKLYLAPRHKGFTRSGVYLWTGKRHRRLVPTFGNGWGK